MTPTLTPQLRCRSVTAAQHDGDYDAAIAAGAVVGQCSSCRADVLITRDDHDRLTGGPTGGQVSASGEREEQRHQPK